MKPDTSRADGAMSFDKPANMQMEPTRPTDLCDPVTAARGSFANVSRTKSNLMHEDRPDHAAS